MDDASTLPHLKEQLALVVEKTPGLVEFGHGCPFRLLKFFQVFTW